MIYCFDLDSTLCTGGFNCLVPYINRIKKVNELYDQGHEIIIETARGSQTGIDHTAITKSQLKKWGVQYHQLRVGIKIYADFYIDDKGISDKEFFD